MEETVDSRGKQLTWREEGIRIEVPAGAVPEGKLAMIGVRKYETVHTQFTFLDDAEPISPVYELYCSHKVFQKRVKISFTSIDPAGTNQRCFVQTSREPHWKKDVTPEYQFNRIPGGEFKPQSGGVIHLKRLNCYLAVASELFALILNCMQMFCFNKLSLSFTPPFSQVIDPSHSGESG